MEESELIMHISTTSDRTGRYFKYWFACIVPEYVKATAWLLWPLVADYRLRIEFADSALVRFKPD